MESLHDDDGTPIWQMRKSQKTDINPVSATVAAWDWCVDQLDNDPSGTWLDDLARKKEISRQKRIAEGRGCLCYMYEDAAVEQHGQEALAEDDADAAGPASKDGEDRGEGLMSDEEDEEDSEDRGEYELVHDVDLMEVDGERQEPGEDDDNTLMAGGRATPTALDDDNRVELQPGQDHRYDLRAGKRGAATTRDAREKTDERAIRHKLDKAQQNQAAINRITQTLLNVREDMVVPGMNQAMNNSQSTEYMLTEPIAGYERSQPEDGQRPFELMPHQRDAIGRWEHLTEKFGGVILADEPGVGKTATVVAVMLRGLRRGEQKGERARYLIVVPKGLMAFWLGEIKRAKDLKPLIYDSNHHRQPRDFFDDYNVILVGPELLGSIYSRLKRCHDDFEESRTAGRERHESDDNKHDKEPGMKQGRKGKKRSSLITERPRFVLWSLEFEQVIVDEGHMVNHESTARHKAASRIKTKTRAIISATPAQNSIREFGTLLHFLQIQPFCNPALFDACFVHKLLKGNVSGTERANIDLNLAILSSIRAAVSIRRYKNAKFDGTTLLNLPTPTHILRKQELRGAEAELQEQTRLLWDLKMRARVQREKNERWLRMRQGEGFETLEGELGTKYALPRKWSELFKLMLQARLAAIHPSLGGGGGYDAALLEDDQTLEDLPYDPENFEDALQAALDKATEVRSGAKDIEGEEEAKKAGRKSPKKRREAFLQQFHSREVSWKSQRLWWVVRAIQILRAQRRQEAAALPEQERKAYMATHKIIVFSDFLCALDLLAIGLQDMAGTTPLRYDGSVSIEDRNAIVQRFQETDKDFSLEHHHPEEQDVLLMTSQTGGLGLTLTNACDVFILNPHWNPSVEDQAIGRVDRKGQERQVTVYRYDFHNSIESRVDETQTVKVGQVYRIMTDEYLQEYVPNIQGLTRQRFLSTIGLKEVKKAIKAGRLELDD